MEVEFHQTGDRNRHHISLTSAPNLRREFKILLTSMQLHVLLDLMVPHASVSELLYLVL